MILEQLVVLLIKNTLITIKNKREENEKNCYYY